MMAMNVRTSVGMATNSGFSGGAVNDALTRAMKDLSSNQTITQADDRVLAAAMDSMKPAAKSEGQDVNRSLPMNNRDSGRSI